MIPRTTLPSMNHLDVRVNMQISLIITIPFNFEIQPTNTDLIHVLESIDDVVRQAGEQVYHKPGLEIVHPDQLGIGDNLASWPDESGVEVEHDVHQEDDVHDAVQNQPGDVVLLGLEGDVVGHHDGRVKGEDEDHPVPRGLEGAVVEDDVRRRLGSFLLVLGQDFRAKLKHLRAERILDEDERREIIKKIKEQT